MSLQESRDSGSGSSPLGKALELVLARLESTQVGDRESIARGRDEIASAIELLRAERLRVERQNAPGPDANLDHDAPSSRVLARLLAHAPRESRYRIDGEVARGGMGVILQAWDGDLRRTLAMKVVLARGADERVEAQALARFLEEAQVTGQLDHPGIVPVHELGIDERGRVFFTMRFVRGRDLGQIFALARKGEEGWSRTRVVGVLLKVCEAMAYAHEKGVIHRDLKPANVMVGRFGEVYVMDWGLAKVVGRRDIHDLRPTARDESRRVEPGSGEAQVVRETPLITVDGTVLGTPAYMAPEQASGDVERIDARSDVYAVGAVLYHLLSDRVPYRDEDRRLGGHSVLERLLAGPPAPIRDLAPDAEPELIAICERAMAREPHQRYLHMLALAEDLRAWLEGRVVRAYESGAWPELKKWVLRNRAFAAASVAALLAVVTGALWSSRVEARGREDLRLTADAYVPAYLLGEVDQLWPADPAVEPRMLAWLDVARDLLSRAELHRERFERSAPSGTEDSVSSRVDRERAQRLLAQIEDLAHAETGLIAQLEDRLARAREIRSRSLESPEAVHAWDEASAAIADRARSPAYGGLRITPQFGLVPLGPDPHSGLWEFAHLPSGEPPRRDGASGELVLTPESSVVLVLVPGGRFWMGEQNRDPSGRHYFDDPRPNDNDPPVQVELAPYLISKYEHTQAQWQRVEGQNPSRFNGPWLAQQRPDLASRVALNPVEQVSWNVCAQAAAKLHLMLPTEAQWEFAARAGSDTTWWTGSDKDSLIGAVNLADRALVRAGVGELGEAAAQDWPELDDGFAAHAPVDTFRANPYGLHCVSGNVWEWCRDRWGPLIDPARAGDGLREGREPTQAALRSGSFESSAASARSANRGEAPVDQAHYVVGVRFARAIEPGAR